MDKVLTEALRIDHISVGSASESSVLVSSGTVDPTNNAPPVQATVRANVGPTRLPEPELAVGDEPSCPVCITNRMDMLLGCGHRLCGGCLTNGRHVCPLCEEPIILWRLTRDWWYTSFATVQMSNAVVIRCCSKEARKKHEQADTCVAELCGM